jgi:predicted phosphodiesterase
VWNSGCGVRTNKFVITILIILVWAGTAFAGQNQQISQKLAALEKIQGKFTFIVLGDNRSGDDIYRKLVGMMTERKPSLIVNTGDQVPDEDNLKDWAKFWKMSKPITVPYFLTVGNHDVNDAKSELFYKKQVDLPGNELYYSFTAGNALFIVLDSYLTGEQKKITGEQYTWLESVLAKSTQRYKFIFLHHPLYPDKDKGRHYGNSLDRYPGDRDKLQALFVKHKVTIVFTGHEHLYLRKTVDGIPHIIAGGGGAPLYAAEKDGGFYHFIVMTVDGDKVSAEVIDIKGKVRDRF